MIYDSFTITVLETLEDLGATYIKLGQFIASAPSIFPHEYVEAFQDCLDFFVKCWQVGFNGSPYGLVFYYVIAVDDNIAEIYNVPCRTYFAFQ